MTAKRNLSFIVILWSLWASLCLIANGAAGQSLFSGGGGAAPMFEQGQGALLTRATPTLLAGRATPLVQARALALTDYDGVSARRADHGRSVVPSLGYRPPSAQDIRRQVAALRDHPPRNFAQQSDLICLAVSIYHEARNQPRDGQAAVATVILNRVANPHRWGNTPCKVVVPVQFSYLRADRGFAPIRNRKAWQEALEIAADVLLQGPDPDLYGADHYHATYVDPPWNRSMEWVMRIDDHIFWKSRPRRQEAG